MSNKKFIVEKRYCISNSDINVVGEMIGLEWNHICDLISEAELSGQDGSGYTIIEPSYKFNNELDQIIEKIFNDNPEAKEIYVIDDF